MRFIVEQKQTVLSRKTISLPSGAKRFASRRTRFRSCPDGPLGTGWGRLQRLDDVLGRADPVRRLHHLVLALRVDQDVHVH
ncbi:hypothetical protein GCM10023084_77360 [Streptomyces lacrimifluminis]|uniref:Uncharacterized protein n=1 Tax=Streptomyces lacrimifluminis TaxID=1500077 RepID=A0A917P9L8_9ACTN|nr:hypothetical protein GCM10012282_76110 [Streptomyces lacrimifluminis]